MAVRPPAYVCQCYFLYVEYCAYSQILLQGFSEFGCRISKRLLLARHKYARTVDLQHVQTGEDLEGQ
jgi:hypothetical protein